MARKQRNSLADLFATDLSSPTFESRIASPDMRIRMSKPWFKSVVWLAVLVSLSSAFIIAGRNVGAQSNHDLAGVSRTFLVALANNNLDAALAVCAESPEGRRLMDEERRRVFGELSGPDDVDPQSRILKRRTLNRLREELAEAGIRWDAVKPLALGGVRARVLQPSLMKEPASLVWGHLYFSGANRLYEIEVTAWQCGDQFVIADVWNWAPVNVAPSEVEAFAKTRSKAFLAQQNETPDDTKIIRPRRIFVAI